MSTPEINLPPRFASLTEYFKKYQSDKLVKPLFEQIIEHLPNLMVVERCSIFLYDPVNKQIMLQYGTGMLERELTLPLAGSLAGEVIQSSIPRIVEDLAPYESIQSEVKDLTGFQTNSMLCVPIHHPKGNGCAGAIQLLNPCNNRRFGVDDINNMTGLCLHLRQPIEELVEQHVKFLQEVERKKNKGKVGLVASFLSKWIPV